MSHRRAGLVLASGIAMATAMATAQSPTAVVVPAAFDTVDAPSLRWVAGAGPALRQQWLIDASHLQPLVGRSIDRLQLRRDASADEALTGGVMEVELQLSTSSRPTASAASPNFADNAGADAVPVHAGSISVPASPAPTGPVAWAAQDVIEIPFQNAFLYGGGVLCIDLIARPVTGQVTPFWPSDAAADPAAGAVQYLGRSCQDPLSVSIPLSGLTHRVFADELVPGATITSFTFGTASAFGSLAIGFDGLQQGIPLDTIGAIGCTLDIALLMNLPVRRFSAPLDPARPELGGSVTEDIHIPPSPALAGARLALQWVELSGVALATTNAAVCDVSTSLPTNGVALVEADATGTTLPTSGKVSLGPVPIVRLSAQ